MAPEGEGMMASNKRNSGKTVLGLCLSALDSRGKERRERFSLYFHSLSPFTSFAVSFPYALFPLRARIEKEAKGERKNEK